MLPSMMTLAGARRLGGGGDDLAGGKGMVAADGVEGAVHGGDGGAQDVEGVDLGGGAGGYGPGEGFLLDEWGAGLRGGLR